MQPSSILRYTAVALGLLLGLSGTAAAQPTNTEVYQMLAQRCLEEVPDTLRAFRLEAPAEMPYLRTALLDTWQQQGRTLFLADSARVAPARALPRLRYQLEEAQVAYERAEGRTFRRTVTLGLRYTLTAPDGRLLEERSCRETLVDAIPRRRRAALEQATFPETQGNVPEAGSWRRYLEPAVLAAAVGIGIYLFFSLRSDSNGDDTP